MNEVTKRRFNKFINSTVGQRLKFEWTFSVDNPALLTIYNKINGVALATFEGPDIYESVVAWALKMHENDMF
ncbi:MAG TPA: hypothetical protein VMX17_09055 [Candidatus Glassbacteria bacterium]|nr:hypothetical protein [Candidatus Glassbacteria bacterium]